MLFHGKSKRQANRWGSLKSFVAMILLALWLVGVIAHSSNGSYRWEIHAPIPPFYDGLSPFYLMISKSQRMASSSLRLDKIGVRLFSFGFWDSLKEWHQFRSWGCDLPYLFVPFFSLFKFLLEQIFVVHPFKISPHILIEVRKFLSTTKYLSALKMYTGYP